jgi:hypothetical protein
MRFDILDEYSTLVPFGLGVFKQIRVVQFPAAAPGTRPGSPDKDTKRSFGLY